MINYLFHLNPGDFLCNLTSGLPLSYMKQTSLGQKSLDDMIGLSSQMKPKRAIRSEHEVFKSHHGKNSVFIVFIQHKCLFQSSLFALNVTDRF